MPTLVCLVAIVVCGYLTPACETPRGAHPSSRLSDDAITKSVKEALVEDRQMNLVRVDVDTEEGTVYLSGEVDTAVHKVRAEDLAKAVKGVKAVVNKLKVHD